MIKAFLSGFVGLIFATVCLANPYYDPNQVPKDNILLRRSLPPIQNRSVLHHRAIGLPVLRVSIKVDSAENYLLSGLNKELTGTAAFYKRGTKSSGLGSYRALLRNAKTNSVIYYDSIGTGKEFRKLVDSITFRFPFPTTDTVFEMLAENPISGVIETVLKVPLLTDNLPINTVQPAGLEIRELKKPTSSGAVARVNIYAEGYQASDKDQFWVDAENTVLALVGKNFPLVENMHFFAVFAPSNEKLGFPQDLGATVEHDSFLGLYFPYWDKFGRWTDVIYPTREEKFREGLAVAPYDYSIVIVNDDQYWGIGNFRELVSVPAKHPSFTYLLIHEIGHYYGLNEEYHDGGRTELEFAPGIFEPWSQNITFLRDPQKLKWAQSVSSAMPIPTPDSYWTNMNAYGAYLGGYAESEPVGQSHIPGHGCVMDRGANYCDICRHAITELIRFDLGI